MAINSFCCFGFSGDNESSRRNMEIDQILKSEKGMYLSTHRLLMLGAGESGKSTVVKQMALAYNQEGFTDQYRQDCIQVIRKNVLDSIIEVIKAMPTFSPPIQLNDIKLASKRDYILTYQPKLNNVSCEFYEYSADLVEDTGVRSCIERGNEFQALDNLSYFLRSFKIREIGENSYEPTDSDILRCRKRTCGIFETKFNIQGELFHVFDVGGQRDERKKWIQCFNDVNAVIYVVDCSAYDKVLREDITTNRLEEALKLFEQIWTNKWLRRVSIILFLNKQDLLKEKIIKGYRIEEFFIEIEAYTPPDISNAKFELIKLEDEIDENPEVRKVRWFIREKFMRISQLSQSHRRLFPHFTTAVDTENITRVFTDCRKIVQLKQLDSFNLDT